jgi:hypothetical protein
MARHIRVRGVLRPEPDVRLYVLALIELARQIQAEEEEEAAGERTRDGLPDAPVTSAEKQEAGK